MEEVHQGPRGAELNQALHHGKEVLPGQQKGLLRPVAALQRAQLRREAGHFAEGAKEALERPEPNLRLSLAKLAGFGGLIVAAKAGRCVRQLAAQAARMA